MIQLTKATLSTALKLERFRGHFYNWYDAPLAKSRAAVFYLLGRQRQSGLFVADDKPGLHANGWLSLFFRLQLWLGIKDRLRLLRQIAGADRVTPLLEAIIAFEDSTLGLQDDSERWIPQLYSLEKSARKLQKIIKATGHESPDLSYWSRDLHDQLRRLRQSGGDVCAVAARQG